MNLWEFVISPLFWIKELDNIFTNPKWIFSSNFKPDLYKFQTWSNLIFFQNFSSNMTFSILMHGKWFFSAYWPVLNTTADSFAQIELEKGAAACWSFQQWSLEQAQKLQCNNIARSTMIVMTKKWLSRVKSSREGAWDKRCLSSGPG